VGPIDQKARVFSDYSSITELFSHATRATWQKSAVAKMCFYNDGSSSEEHYLLIFFGMRMMFIYVHRTQKYI
jgi:hypothetical protein